MRVYLDNNATTKMDNEVFEAMVPYLTEYYGNASSLHLFGKETNKAMNESRETIAKHLGVEPNEIIFTASGSESDNLAIRGIARAYKNRGKHIIASPIEHPAIKNTLKDLEDEGYEITILHVDKNGVLNIEELKNAIKDETILITVMHANNEVGTFQPIEEIGKIAKENKIIFHVDAVQTMGKVDIKPKEMGIDLLSFSAHKFYGPKGIAALYWRNGVRFGKVLTGGGQEGKRRPGTSSITFKYLEGESILLSLSYKGIAVSSGSACSSDDLQASHVLLAMGIEPEFAHGTIRFGLGKYNTKEEIDYTLDVLVEVIEKLRAISPLWNEFKNK